MSNKIKVFHSGLTTNQLKKRLRGKTGRFTKIVLTGTGLLLLALSFIVMGYNRKAGSIILLCLLLLAAFLWTAEHFCYFLLEHGLSVRLEEDRLSIHFMTGKSGFPIHKTTVPYHDIKKYYIGRCSERFLPVIKGRRILTPGQCADLYGDYINLLGDGTDVLAVIPYTKERERFLLKKSKPERLTEEEYYGITGRLNTETQQEKEMMKEYEGYPN